MLHPSTQCPLAVYLCVYDVLIAAKAHGEVKCIRHGPCPHRVHGLAEESRRERNGSSWLSIGQKREQSTIASAGAIELGFTEQEACGLRHGM